MLKTQGFDFVREIRVHVDAPWRVDGKEKDARRTTLALYSLRLRFWTMSGQPLEVASAIDDDDADGNSWASDVVQ